MPSFNYSRNTKTQTELSRAPVEDKSFFKHLVSDYQRVKDDGSSLKPLRALVRALRHKYRVEKLLRAHPPYPLNHRQIIIDVTHYCNLGCDNCNRSCGNNQANSKENMTVGQIEEFVNESIEQKRTWEVIILEGGEPTIHPNILEIVDVLVNYKREYASSTTLIFATNGYAKGSEKILAKLPPDIDVNNSSKDTVDQAHHLSFNRAPQDIIPEKEEQFSNGCLLPAIYGLGLNRCGYYPHPVCGGIDRVFGVDIGKKSLPKVGDDLSDMYNDLCRYCGHFYDSNLSENEKDLIECKNLSEDEVTPSWKKAYEDFWENRPKMTLYAEAKNTGKKTQ